MGLSTWRVWYCVSEQVDRSKSYRSIVVTKMEKVDRAVMEANEKENQAGKVVVKKDEEVSKRGRLSEEHTGQTKIYLMSSTLRNGFTPIRFCSAKPKTKMSCLSSSLNYP